MSREVTLTNEFHNTEARVRPVPITAGRFAGLHKISRRTALRLKAALCPSQDCLCGGTFGERGGERLEVMNEDQERAYIVRRVDRG